MRKVKNGKAIRRLSVKSFQASRARNWIAAVAIALTTILFTAVFTIGLGIVETTQHSTMLSVGGDMHGSFKNITREQLDILKAHPSIKKYGLEESVASAVDNPEFLKRRLEMHYVEKNIYPNWFVEILDGEAPVEADEILLDEKSMQLLGLKPQAGQQVTLQMRVHDGDTTDIERTFAVSGVIRSSEAMNVGFAFVSDAYLEKYAEELRPRNAYDTGSLNLHVFFDNSARIQEKLNKVITDSGFSTDASSPDYIDSNANWAYLSDGIGKDPVTMLAIGASLVLILITGYLIIYNIFQISVIRDVRYYGLLKTIGTTGRQIKRILRRQVLWLCLLGVPAGLVLGFLCGKLMLPMIAQVRSFEKSSIAVSPQPWIFIGAAVFTVFTVIISERRPARIAAKVSPVEALRYTEHGLRRKKQKKTTDGGKIGRMAFSNLGRSRGRTAVVVCSLSLTVILLNSIYTITHSVDRAGFLSKMILSEDLIANAGLWNFDYRPWNEETAAQQSLTESFIEAVNGQESFADGGRIYMTEYHVRMPVDTWEAPDYFEKNEEGVPGYWTPLGFEPFAGYEGGAYFVAYHGIERFVLSKMTVTEGETDKDAIWEKLQTGDYLLYAAPVDDNSQVIPTEVKHHAGDKVTFAFEGGGSKEYEILSVIKSHQFSLTNKFHQEFSYYVSADEFKRHLSASYLMSYLFDTREGQEKEMEAFLKDYTETVEPMMNYESRTTYEGTLRQLIGIVTLVGTVLAAVIGLIGMLNFVNTILTSMITRQHEFAMMEAIGMTKRQLTGMLMTEGFFYALLTVVFSLLIGILFSITALRAVGDGLWLMNYRFTVLPMLVACPVMLAMGVCIPKAVYAFQKDASIVERIRE